MTPSPPPGGTQLVASAPPAPPPSPALPPQGSKSPPSPKSPKSILPSLLPSPSVSPSAPLRLCVENLPPPPSRVHLIGATGIGMAGLARLLAADGHRVTGCDASPAPRLAAWLASAGIPVASPHDPAHLDSADWAVYSPAVPPSHPELAAARRKNLPLYPRGAVLAALASSPARRTLAVAGTHGKTTTSALLAHLLRATGTDAAFCVGGETHPTGAPALPGTAPELVVEADESDGTLAAYSPFCAVVTNIEFDHADHFPSFDAFRDVFRTFARQSARLVACADDPEAAALAADTPSSLLYGLSPSAPFHATDIAPTPSGTSFTAVTPTGTIPLFLPLPGLHNVRNTLAALAALSTLPSPPPLSSIPDALAAFRLPRRRLDIHPTPSGITLIADYAHHPTEIRALLSAVRQLYPASRLLAAFQPHRYTRTRLLGPQFPDAFSGVAAGVLLPVYAASEPPIPGATSDALLPLFNRVAPWTLSPDLPSCADSLLSLARPTDILLLVGAGSIDALLPLLLSRLS